MRRREFIRLFGQPQYRGRLQCMRSSGRCRRIGFVTPASPAPLRQQIAAFHEGLKNSDYVEGQTVAVEYSWAEGQYDRLPALVADLVRQQVSVIVAGVEASRPCSRPRRRPRPFPLFSAPAGDPVRSGLVASLNQPSGNITGASRIQFIASHEGARQHRERTALSPRLAPSRRSRCRNRRDQHR